MQIPVVVVFHKGPAVDGAGCVWRGCVLSLSCSWCFPSPHGERPSDMFRRAEFVRFTQILLVESSSVSIIC